MSPSATRELPRGFGQGMSGYRCRCSYRYIDVDMYEDINRDTGIDIWLN